MRRVFAIALLAGALLGYATLRGAHGSSSAATDHIRPQLAAFHGKASGEPPARGLILEPGSKHEIGEFGLGNGRSIHVSKAEALSGETCLVEEDTRAGMTAGCQQAGLFGVRKVAFSLHTDGGPATFDELYVVGAVAPGVGALDVVLSDGTALPIALGEEGAFLFRSTERQLAERTYPTTLRLYAPSGRLVESVSFPPPA